MNITAKDKSKHEKVKVSDHEIYGVTTILSLLIPTVGIVLGIIYLSKSSKVDRKLGEHLIAIGMLSCIVGAIIWYSFFTPRAVLLQDSTYTPPISTGADTVSPVDSTWDVNTTYTKITKGMTKSSVESAIGKIATNCSEAVSSGSTDKYASCIYGGLSDHGIIVVNYVNDLVTTTEKATY